MKYQLLSTLISWVFPTKNDRERFRIFCQELDNRKKVPLIQSRYPYIIEKLRKKIQNKQRLKVVFLNSENSKWSYQALYEQFEKNPKFEVQVLITVRKKLFKKKYKFLEYEKQVRANYNFFRKRGMKVSYAFDLKNNKYIDLKEFSPDIIFYEQPWELPKTQTLYNVSKFALPLLCNYSTSISNGEQEYSLQFFKYVYTYFVDSNYIKDLLVKHGCKNSRIYVAGQPKLDSYLRPLNDKNILWQYSDKKRIIWAPHFSFFKESMLGFGTFDWNYKFLLNFAQNHTEFEFILKPHPDLRRQIVRQKLMTQDEMIEYFNKWQNLENAQVYELGDYFDMFRTSDLMITDCNSFLCEYLPTEKPLIHLIGKYSKGLNDYGKSLVKGYYSANNINDIEALLDSILFRNEDPKLNVRKNIIENILQQPESGVAKTIVNHMLEMIHEEEK